LIIVVNPLLIMKKQLSLALQEIEQVLTHHKISSCLIRITIFLWLQIAFHQAEEHARYQSTEPSNEFIELIRCTHHIEEAALITT
jgi:hypothetical protein